MGSLTCLYLKITYACLFNNIIVVIPIFRVFYQNNFIRKIVYLLKKYCKYIFQLFVFLDLEQSKKSIGFTVMFVFFFRKQLIMWNRRFGVMFWRFDIKFVIELIFSFPQYLIFYKKSILKIIYFNYNFFFKHFLNIKFTEHIFPQRLIFYQNINYLLSCIVFIQYLYYIIFQILSVANIMVF